MVFGLSSFAVEVDIITGLAGVTDDDGWTTFKDNLVSTVLLLLALLDADVEVAFIVASLDGDSVVDDLVGDDVTSDGDAVVVLMVMGFLLVGSMSFSKFLIHSRS